MRDPVKDILEGRAAKWLGQYTLEQVPEWICKNTRLDGKPFSFVGHEYQLRILRSPAPVVVVKKCSQVGISELMARRLLALTNLIDNFTAIFTLPTVDFARKFTKTRIDPIISNSEYLKSRIHTSLDNSEVKQFGDNNFLYIRGTFGANQAISVPADMVAHDEVDFSNPDALSSFQSRLTHSTYRWKMLVSTPTVAKVGVSGHFDASRRFYNFVKCHHCGHFFLPDFSKHIILPGFDGHLLELTRDTIHKYAVDDAYLACPQCGNEPDLSPEHRDWVCENSEERHDAEGFQVQPFDAPTVVSIPYLLRASVSYKRKVDFINFNLGKEAEDADSGITEADLAMMFGPRVNSYHTHVMGVDMGQECHIVISGVCGYDRMDIVHTEIVHYSKVADRVGQLIHLYRILAVVVDSQPYVETVYRLQQAHQQVFGSVYVTSKNLDTFTLRARDDTEEESRGLLEVRQVNVNRNKAFDGLLEYIRAGNLHICNTEHEEKFKTHLQDMKRVRDIRAYEESYLWQKSAQGDDHFFHALLYCWVAFKLRGLDITDVSSLPVGVFSFRVK